MGWTGAVCERNIESGGEAKLPAGRSLAGWQDSGGATLPVGAQFWRSRAVKSGQTQVRIIRVPFLVPGWASAQVLLPGRIFVRRDIRMGVRMLSHELVHLDQVERLGLLRYWLTYLALLLYFGYREHPMELDAVVRSAEPHFLLRSRELLTGEAARAGERPIPSGHPLDVR